MVVAREDGVGPRRVLLASLRLLVLRLRCSFQVLVFFRHIEKFSTTVGGRVTYHLVAFRVYYSCLHLESSKIKLEMYNSMLP